MGGAPITVICYRNGVLSCTKWITDPHILARVRALAKEGGEALIEDVLWNNREPWADELARDWPAVDSLHVRLRLEEDHVPTPPPGRRK